MSDDEFENGEGWVLYADRPDWQDIAPVPQDDGPNPVVSIAYSKRFTDVYDYFRAVLKNKEKSMRAFHLTKDAIDLNPANYTVWQYRRELIQALDIDLLEELDYLRQIIDSSSKNYQVWHHRRVIIEWMKDPSQELQFTAYMLEQDPKNYHAWQHRQWVIKTFNLFDGELEYVENLINEDFRNNSAWNQRYFVVSNTTGFTDSVIDREVSFALSKIKLSKNNESSWNYLRGVLFHDKKGISGNSSVTSFCEDLYNNKNRSPFLLALIIDMCDEVINKNENSDLYNSERGLDLCKAMSEKYDRVRTKYWMYLSHKFMPKESNNISPETPLTNSSGME